MEQLLMMLIPALLSMFGGQQGQTTETETETPRRGFQWPGLPAEATRMYGDLLGNREMFRGWGQAPGMVNPTDNLMGDWSADLIRMLQEAWPDLMGDLGGGEEKSIKDIMKSPKIEPRKMLKKPGSEIPSLGRL